MKLEKGDPGITVLFTLVRRNSPESIAELILNSSLSMLLRKGEFWTVARDFIGRKIGMKHGLNPFIINIWDNRGEEEMDVTTVTQKLRQNPYEVYRDPLTGKWMVIKNPKVAGDRHGNHSKPLSNLSQSLKTGEGQELPPDCGEPPLKE